MADTVTIPATTPARSEHAAVIRDIALDLKTDLEHTDYGQLNEWDTVELIGRTIAVLGDLLDADGGC